MGPKQGNAKPEERPKRVYLRFQWVPHYTSKKMVLRPYASHQIPEATRNPGAWSAFVPEEELSRREREAYQAVVRLSEDSSPAEAIAYLKRCLAS